MFSHIFSAHSTCSGCGGMKPQTLHLHHGGMELLPEDGPGSGLFAAVWVYSVAIKDAAEFEVESFSLPSSRSSSVISSR